MIHDGISVPQLHVPKKNGGNALHPEGFVVNPTTGHLIVSD
jgi:hypothetical protein